MSGGEIFGFNNAVFLSEREAADRNYALGFYMRENKCFPEKCNLRECMDFYFQVSFYIFFFPFSSFLTGMTQTNFCFHHKQYPFLL